MMIAFPSFPMQLSPFAIAGDMPHPLRPPATLSRGTPLDRDSYATRPRRDPAHTAQPADSHPAQLSTLLNSTIPIHSLRLMTESTKRGAVRFVQAIRDVRLGGGPGRYCEAVYLDSTPSPTVGGAPRWRSRVESGMPHSRDTRRRDQPSLSNPRTAPMSICRSGLPVRILLFLPGACLDSATGTCLGSATGYATSGGA